MKKDFIRIIALILVVVTAFSVSSFPVFSAYFDSAEITADELYSEEFYWDKAGEDADNGYKAYQVAFGKPLIVPEDPERYGQSFKGWKDWYTDEFVDISTQVMDSTSGRRFYAAWESDMYTVNYYVDDILYETFTLKPGTLVKAIEAPEKEGYTFVKWYGSPVSPLTVIYDLPFTMPKCNVNVFALYEKSTYNSYFYVDGKLFTTVVNTVGQSLITPRLPQKDGYRFVRWDPKPPEITPAEELYFNAVFEPEQYIATLIVGGEVYETIPYTYGQKSIPLPPVPKKEGYTGAWEGYTLGIGGVTINAVYTANTYNSYFYVDGSLFTTITNVFDQSFIVPRSPQKDGYEFAGWNPELPKVTPAGELSFNAVFKPEQYIATLLVDGKVYKEIPYTYGQKSIQLPPVPEKTGYTGEWERYSLVIGGITINAIYTPATYKVILMADGEVYKEIPYTYGEKSIDLPPVPEKEGYTGKWESYTLTSGDLTINAVYTQKRVKIVNVEDVELTYRETAKLDVSVYSDEGVVYTVKFGSSDPKTVSVDENGNVCGLKKGSAEITVAVIDSLGNIKYDTCTVTVKYSFLQWLIKILLFGWIWY